MVHRLLKDTHAPRGTPVVYGANGVDLLHIKNYDQMTAAEGVELAANLGEFSNMVGLLKAVAAESRVSLELEDKLDALLTRLGEAP